MEGGIKIKEIDQEDLDKIKGGAAVSIWTGIVIAAIVVFISGVIEGITNPERCHGWVN